MVFSDMKASELKSLAKEKGIKGADGMNKAALIVALESDSPAQNDQGKGQAPAGSGESKKPKQANKVAAKNLKFQNVKGE